MQGWRSKKRLIFKKMLIEFKESYIKISAGLIRTIVEKVQGGLIYAPYQSRKLSAH